MGESQSQGTGAVTPSPSVPDKEKGNKSQMRDNSTVNETPAAILKSRAVPTETARKGKPAPFKGAKAVKQLYEGQFYQEIYQEEDVPIFGATINLPLGRAESGNLARRASKAAPKAIGQGRVNPQPALKKRVHKSAPVDFASQVITNTKETANGNPQLVASTSQPHKVTKKTKAKDKVKPEPIHPSHDPRDPNIDYFIHRVLRPRRPSKNK